MLSWIGTGGIMVDWNISPFFKAHSLTHRTIIGLLWSMHAYRHLGNLGRTPSKKPKGNSGTKRKGVKNMYNTFPYHFSFLNKQQTIA
jgi:hypothetical protein